MFPATSGARTARKNIRQIAGDEPGLSLLVALFFWPWKHVGHIKFVIEAFHAHFELRAVDTKATTVRSASSNRVAYGHEDEGRSARKSAILLFTGHMGHTMWNFASVECRWFFSGKSMQQTLNSHFLNVYFTRAIHTSWIVDSIGGERNCFMAWQGVFFSCPTRALQHFHAWAAAHDIHLIYLL